MALFKNNKHHNYLFLFLEGLCFSLGLVFFDSSTILPLLMQRFTDSAILVGLVGMAPAFSMGLTALLAGNYGRSIKFKKSFILKISSAGRLPLWILGLTLLFFPLENPFFWAFLILAIQFVFWLADGAVFTAWTDLIAKSISGNFRGRFLSFMQIISGIISIFAAMMVSRILNLDFLNFPRNYGLLLTIGAILFTLSIFMFGSIKEKEASITTRRDSIIQLVKKLPDYFRKNVAFSRSMLTLFLCTLATIALPFYIVYAENIFGLGETEVGFFISARIIGRILGAFFYGVIGDKFGHEQGVKIFSFSTGIPVVFALLLNPGLPDNLVFILFVLIFFFIGVMQTGGWSVFMNYMIDVVNASDRTLFAGFTSLIKVPASIAPLLGGFILNKAGFLPVFLLAALFSLLGIYTSFILPAADRTSFSQSAEK